MGKLDTTYGLNDFLLLIGMNLDEYLLAFRSSITKDTVFLERTSKDIWTNNYNETLLGCNEANMDMQIVLDPYGAVEYLVKYVGKEAEGTSELLDKVKEKGLSDSKTAKQIRAKVANTFLNHHLMGTQEAVAHVLGLNFVRKSRAVY